MFRSKVDRFKDPKLTTSASLGPGAYQKIEKHVAKKEVKPSWQKLDWD